MKGLLILALAASVALNTAFAALVLKRRSASPPLASGVAVTADPVGTSPTIDAGVWPTLGGEDLPTLVARLRSAGFPPDILRAILAAQLSESFAARREALQSGADNLPFWKDQPRDPQRERALLQLAREQEKAMRALLGADAESDDPMSRLYQNRSLGFLSPEKAVDVRAILRDYDERRADLYAAGVNTITDREKSTALDKEQHDRIAQLLTPTELLEYDLRHSPSAGTLRSELEAFQPSEQEFRTLYQLRAPFDERFNQSFGPMLSVDERRQREEAQKLLTEQIKATLGPERGAEYERATDYNYLATNLLVARLELPPETTSNLWAVQKEFEQRRSELNSRPQEDRAQRLAALQQEAIERITPLLGNARAVEAYKQFGGQWLRTLTPRQIATPPPPPKN